MQLSCMHQYSAYKKTPVHGLNSIPSTSFGSCACNSPIERLQHYVEFKYLVEKAKKVEMKLKVRKAHGYTSNRAY